MTELAIPIEFGAIRSSPIAIRNIDVRIRPSTLLYFAIMASLLCASGAKAADSASKDEAVAMVRKAVAFIKQDGPEKAYPEISDRAGQFVDRDLYVVVYQLDGKVLAHGGNEKFVGKDVINAQDIDGKLFVKERVELAAAQASFWQDYKIVNPVSKKIEPKQMYCERLDDTAVCAGVYKP
jgi:signal transduction histidine kinase